MSLYSSDLKSVLWEIDLSEAPYNRSKAFEFDSDEKNVLLHTDNGETLKIQTP